MNIVRWVKTIFASASNKLFQSWMQRYKSVYVLATEWPITYIFELDRANNGTSLTSIVRVKRVEPLDNSETLLLRPEKENIKIIKIITGFEWWTGTTRYLVGGHTGRRGASAVDRADCGGSRPTTDVHRTDPHLFNHFPGEREKKICLEKIDENWDTDVLFNFGWKIAGTTHIGNPRNNIVTRLFFFFSLHVSISLVISFYCWARWLDSMTVQTYKCTVRGKRDDDPSVPVSLFYIAKGEWLLCCNDPTCAKEQLGALCSSSPQEKKRRWNLCIVSRRVPVLISHNRTEEDWKITYFLSFWYII